MAPIVDAFHVPEVRVPTPVIFAYDPINLADGSVPLVMFAAFVVSVVAEAARPDTAAEVIEIAVLVTPVTCPWAFVVSTGTEEAEPYVPAVPVFVMLNWVPLRVSPVPAE